MSLLSMYSIPETSNASLYRPIAPLSIYNKLLEEIRRTKLDEFFYC